MNPKRLILVIAVVFVGIWVTDFLIHGVWLISTYKATASLWRPETEMKIGWMMLAQLLFASTFVIIWSRSGASVPTLGTSCLYGLTMGLLSQSMTLVTYSVQPLPADLAVKWFVAGLAQATLMGVLVFLVGKPKQPTSRP